MVHSADITKVGGLQIQHQLMQSSTASKSDGQTPGESLADFGQLLKDSLGSVNQLQNSAEQLKQSYATGGDVQLHHVMIATERAELSMEMTMQIRNKLLTAYQEISHMAI